MGDYLSDLELFLDNPASAQGMHNNASPNPVPSPAASTTTTTSTTNTGVRELLRNHLNGSGSGEKRKLDDPGGHSDLLAKSQRTDDSQLMLDSFEQNEFKADQSGGLNGSAPQMNNAPPLYGSGNVGSGHHQGGILAQALMVEKRPNHPSHGNNFGVGSPMSGLGSPSPMAPVGMGASPQPGIATGVASPTNRPPDMAAIRQQLNAINMDHTLEHDQKSARITELLNQYPHIKRMLLSNKLQKEKNLRRSMAPDPSGLMSSRDQLNGSPMIPQQLQQQQSEYGGGLGMGDSVDSFSTTNNPYFDNSINGAAPFGGISNGHGGPPPSTQRMRGGRSGLSQPLPGMAITPGFHNQGTPELWDMNYGANAMNNRLPGNGQHPPQPPPQYPQYRQMVSKQPTNMVGPNSYNQGPGEYMISPGMYNPQQQPGYMGQRGAMPNDPMYANEPIGPGMRSFNPPGYPGGPGLRMTNPYASDNFQGDYMIPPHQQQPHQQSVARNIRHPDFMYQQHPRMANNMMINSHQGMPPTRGMSPAGFGMMSPRLHGPMNQMSPAMSAGPMHGSSMPMGGQLPPPPSSNGNMHNMYNGSNNVSNGYNLPPIGTNGNNSNGNNNNNSGMSNGFSFNDEYLGNNNPAETTLPTSNDDGGRSMQELLGLDELSPNISGAGSVGFNNNNNTLPSWKLNAVDIRREMLNRILTALKDSQPAFGNNIETEASSVEDEAFNNCETKELYYHRLAEWLAAKFGQLSQQQATATPNALNAFPDSTTSVQDGNVSCPKLSSSSDLLHGPASTDSFGMSDQLAKANPILAETLAAATVDLGDMTGSASAASETKENDSFSSATSSPAGSATTTTTTTTTSSSKSMSDLCSPAGLTTAGSTNTPSGTTDAASPLPPATTTSSSRPMPTGGDNNNFHRPNVDTNQSIDKVIQRAPTSRRASGKGNNNNNPHSVDSGIGSPRSTASSSLYSPKLLGSSPSLIAISHSETSPGKLS